MNLGSMNETLDRSNFKPLLPRLHDEMQTKAQTSHLYEVFPNFRKPNKVTLEGRELNQVGNE